jgi:aspartate carbamoyltransferase catalytic subunit
MPGRSLVDLDEFCAAELLSLLDLAAEFKLHPPPAALRGVTVVNLFFEPSTRTFVSFCMAEAALGAQIVSLNPTVSSVVKGETIEDTAATLSAMGVGGIVTRHSQPGFPAALAAAFDGFVVNAGDGAHAHPTQALLDMLTMREEFGRIAGLRVAIVGDVLHSRVARSNALGLRALGAEVIYAGPRTLLPPGLAAGGIRVEYDLDAILPELDAIMMLRVQRERFGQGETPRSEEYAAAYRLDARRLGLLAPHAIVMHPGPYNRGFELTDDVIASPRWRYPQQVRNGVFARMAVLDAMVNGLPGERPVPA